MSPGHDRLRVVLTGASGGIGHHIASALAADCASLLLVGRDQYALSALQDELQKKFLALAVSTAAVDLGTPAGRACVLAAAQAMPGGINLLINNAGISDFHGFATQTPGTLEAIIQTNLLSPMLLTQQLLPLLQANKASQIVNIGSVFGDIGYPGFAAYCASKFGLRGFSQALRRELADSSIRVRYFAPRATRTAINISAVDRMNGELATAMDEPAAVAAAFCRFLAGGKAESVLGWPEKLYVLINRLRHQLTDKAIGKQLAIIKKHLPT